MRLHQRTRSRLFRASVESLEDRIALSLTFQFDYSYDSSGFFTAHPEAKTVLQQAAQLLGSRINDHLAAIVPNASNGNVWDAIFSDPSSTSGNQITVHNPTVPADTILVYVGGFSLAGTFAGEGGTGGYYYPGTGTPEWASALTTRGTSGAPSGWGGKVSFNTQTAWSFATTAESVPSDKFDFLTVAIHELGHVLGLGMMSPSPDTSTAWESLVNSTNDTFVGSHAESSYGGPVPLNYAGQLGEYVDTHWASNVLSSGLEPSLSVNPVINGHRKYFTSLDWAGLQDIGWHVDQAVVTTQPPSSLSVGTGFSLTVSIQDPAGQVDRLFNGPVTLSLGTSPVGGVLSGVLTVNAVQGVATFGGLGLNLAGGTYTIQASSPNVALTTSNTIVTTLPSDIGRLDITSQPPASVVAGGAFGFVTSVKDSSGNVITGYNGPVTVGIFSGPVGSLLSGTTTVNAVNGVATFSGLAITRAGSGFVLQVSATSISSGMTSAFSVVPGVASKLSIQTQPPGVVTVGRLFGMVVQVTDAYGNLRSDRSDQITLSLASNPGGATLGGTTVVNAVNGVATVTGMTLNRLAQGYTIQASAGGLTATVSAPFAVRSGDPASLRIVGQPTSPVNTGSGFTVVANLLDAGGNLATGFNGTATIFLATNPGRATLTGLLTVNVVSGVATFSGLVLNYPGDGFSLRVVASSGQSATTSAFSVTGRPGFGGNNQALSIAGVVAIYTGRGRKRKLVGFEIDYRSPIDGSTGYDPSNYIITETVRQRRKLVGRRVGVVTGPGGAANSVRLTLIGKHPFALGGNLVIRSSPPSGIIGANGNYLASGDQTITILKNVKGIV